MILVIFSGLMLFSIACTRPFLTGNDTGFMLLNETVILIGIFLSALFIKDESETANAVVSSLYIGLVIICCAYSLVYMVYALIFDTFKFFEHRNNVRLLRKAALNELNDKRSR